MNEYIAFDSHKHYTLAERQEAKSGRTQQRRIEHRPGSIRRYLRGAPPGGSVAVEAMGSWYWIVDEIEQAGLVPRLIHARKAKLMMGMINKTDKLDVHGLNRLQRNGTLPTVWIPPAELRDLRELSRTRMTLTQQRVRLKNRLTATLAKYGLQMSGYSDPYGAAARHVLKERMARLPRQTRWVSHQLLRQLDFVVRQIGQQERRIRTLVRATPSIQRVMTLPGVGEILSTTIVLEVGDVSRFPSPEHLASYSGTTPRVHASGDKTRYGRLRQDVNRYLKWAFIEAANVVALHHRRWPDRHVSQLYRRLRQRKNHAKAVGAVARHLAEATYWILRRRDLYRDPALGRTRKAEARSFACGHEPRKSECDRPSE